LVHLHTSLLRDGVSVTFRDGPVRIDDCDIVVLDAFNCSLVEVTDSYAWDIVLWDSELALLGNCSVDYFNIIDRDLCDIVLDNCFIGRFGGDVGFYRLNASDSVIDDFYPGQSSEMNLNGMNVTFQSADMSYLSLHGDYNLGNNTLPALVFGGSPSANITVCRMYPVRVQRGDTPVEGAVVEVLDGDEVIRNAITDGDGYAVFQLVYFKGYRRELNTFLQESNLTNSYTLRVTEGSETYTQSLGAYTVTPINVAFENSVNRNVLLLIVILCLLSSIVLIWRAKS